MGLFWKDKTPSCSRRNTVPYSPNDSKVFAQRLLYTYLLYTYFCVVVLADENLNIAQEDTSDSENEEKEDGKSCTLQLCDLGFKVEPGVANLVLQLRQKWSCLFLRRMRAPSKPWSQIDEVV